jgi:hypothetical protein
MSAGYNVTFLENKVLEVNNGTGFIEGGSLVLVNLRHQEWKYPIGYFYGYKTDGIFQNQAEINAHPSQIGLGVMRHLEIFVMLM